MYQNPQQGGSPFASGYSPPILAELVQVRLPGYAVFLCIAAIVLAVIAMAGGAVVGLAPGFFGRYDPRSVNRGQESVEQIMDRAQLIDKRYLSITKPLNIVQGVIGIVMIIGAIFTLQQRQPGDLLLRGCFAATLAVSAFHMLPFVAQMAETQAVAADLHAKAQQLSGQESAMATGYGNMWLARSTASLGIGFVWLLFKLGLLGHGIYYLGKREVQAALR